VLNQLQLFTRAVSLGDVDSLACDPASTPHSLVTAALGAQDAITEGLIELNVGMERPDDLITDLQHARGQAARCIDAAMAQGDRPFRCWPI